MYLQLSLFFSLLVFSKGREIDGRVEKEKPFFWKKADTARWLAHENLWGTLSTTSVHLNGRAWGQPKSFVDGSIEQSTGIPYFYDSDMDTSMEDASADPAVTFSITQASLGMCNVDHIDPEDPRCARVSLSGKFAIVTDEDELEFARNALYERHPTMTSWPDDHSWKIHKLVMDEIWLIDIFGGASFISPEDYYAVDVAMLDVSVKNSQVADMNGSDDPVYSTCSVSCPVTAAPICTCSAYSDSSEDFNTSETIQRNVGSSVSCTAACPAQVQPLCTCITYSQ